jgi:peptide/nickel transport system substrate-binding protein
VFEPLAFYNVFTDTTYMWLAESYEFALDFKTLTVKTRSGIAWSDGAPFSAEDVAYTLTSLVELGSKVPWGNDVKQFVDTAVASDANTVVIKFKVPAPRFFYFMTYKFSNGVFIVPKHIFAGQDWQSFKNFDLDKGWPVTTSPFKVAIASPEQKVFDRRASWWAVDQKLAPMPQMERVIWLPFPGEQQTAQALITNQIDVGPGLQPATFAPMFAQNANITTHTGHNPPLGNIDWWPISLFVNNAKPPFDDKAVRWAMSYYIDRKTLVDVAYLGANDLSPLPMPDYPALKPYKDSIKDLLTQYDTLAFDPKKGDALLKGRGYTKDGDNYWVDAQGKRISIEILGTGAVGPATIPVIAQMFKKRGIEAKMVLPPNFYDRFQKGDYEGAIFGHGGSLNEPYDTLKLYQSKSIAIPGDQSVNFAKWHNDAYDRLVDEMAAVAPTDKVKLAEIYHKAMEIWLPELPDIQLVQNTHRIPMNTTYWKNFPTAENPYAAAAHWFLTYPLVLWHLQPTQA